jgi:cytochrome c biogenesis factor
MVIPLIFYLLIIVDGLYGFTRKKRECKEKTFKTELVYFFHVLIMTYSVLSPFFLKDYISNLMFNATMMLSWFMTHEMSDRVICVLSSMEDIICKDDEPLRQVPTEYIVLTTSVMLYDIYMLLRA